MSSIKELVASYHKAVYSAHLLTMKLASHPPPRSAPGHGNGDGADEVWIMIKMRMALRVEEEDEDADRVTALPFGHVVVANPRVRRRALALEGLPKRCARPIEHHLALVVGEFACQSPLLCWSGPSSLHILKDPFAKATQ